MRHTLPDKSKPPRIPYVNICETPKPHILLSLTYGAETQIREVAELHLATLPRRRGELKQEVQYRKPSHHNVFPAKGWPLLQHGDPRVQVVMCH